jgi:hypothetical protein
VSISTTYQGETIELRQELDIPVDSARFYLISPTGIQSAVAASLATDRMSASASIDLADACESGRWRWACVTGGAGSKRYEEHVLYVQARATTGAVAPTDPYWTNVYYGVGTTGLSSVTTLISATLSDELTFSVSPVAQKVYFVHPTSVVIASILHDGLPLGVLASRSIIVDGVAHTVLESTWALTYTALDFTVTRTV